jgi:hypothetical protein
MRRDIGVLLGRDTRVPATNPRTRRGHQVTVEIDDLVVGRVNQHPIHDTRDVLLLGAGQAITPQVKARLRMRSRDGVKMHARDVERLTVVRRIDPGVPSAPEPQSQPTVAERRKLRFDAAVRSGPRYVSNDGPPLVERMSSRGPVRYDTAHRRHVDDRLTASLDGLGDMLRAVGRRGGDVDAERLRDVAANLIGDLVEDRDALLSATLAGGLPGDLARHGLAMARLGMAIAAEIGLNEANVERVGIAGLVHDWGMLRVPVAIRDKAGRLSVAERLEMQRHPHHTVDILEDATRLPALVRIAANQVHERLDGKGYPRGRSGNGIHLFARILHVADRYVALRSPRPHRRAFSPYTAIRTLLEDSAGSADPLVLRALLHVVSLFPVGSYVMLSDASLARVLRANDDAYDSPTVEIVQTAAGTNVEEGPLVDLRDSPLVVVRALPTPGVSETHRTVHEQHLRQRPHFVSPTAVAER